MKFVLIFKDLLLKFGCKRFKLEENHPGCFNRLRKTQTYYQRTQLEPVADTKNGSSPVKVDSSALIINTIVQSNAAIVL